MKRQEAVLLLTSVAVLADEVVFIRAFSISQWHHFAYMVISIALLGFGASGTLIAIFRRKRGISSPAQVHEHRWTALFAILFAITIPVAFGVVQRIPFDPFAILWDRWQLLYLGSYYLIMFVPFFAAATVIGLILTGRFQESPQLYFYNLVGSAAGAALSVALLEIAAVEQVVVAIAAIAQAAALLALLDAATVSTTASVRQLVGVAVVAMFGVLLYFAAHPPALRLSQYKGLSYALNVPNARLLTTRSSAIGRIDVVESAAIRHAPGLSLVTPKDAPIPSQLGLFADGETAGAITAFNGNTDSVGYLDWMSTAAPYFARQSSPRVCVLGAGGGANVLLALRHGAEQVDAIELDANVVRLLRTTFRNFSGELYNRSDVDVHVDEARSFMESSRKQWDVIDISLVDSFAAAAVGLGAVNESYLYTQEALTTYLRHLRPQGVLSVTRWLRTPPRDEIKLFASAVLTLESMGLNPADRLVLVRSWATATLLIKSDPFLTGDTDSLRRWAEERLFDIAYMPGIRSDAANRFNVLTRDWYAEATERLLSRGLQRDAFFREYPFFVKPATDSQPYFFHFFHWRALPQMFRSETSTWLPLVEWGYLILLATLVQSAVLAVMLVLAPLLVLRRRKSSSHARRERRTRFFVFAYFLALGMGFMFVEMPLIQRLVFFLASPVYAVALVLAGLLFVSGLGSRWAALQVARGRDIRRLASMAAIAVAAIAAVYAFGLYPLLQPLLAMPLAARVAVAFAVMIPLAGMGMLFPLGLSRLGQVRAELLPWAWAVNGCASVVATSLATTLALGAGFVVVLLSAGACYLVAAFAIRQYSRC
jgi:hypothetical protein